MAQRFVELLASAIDALSYEDRCHLSLLLDWELTLAEIAAVLELPLTETADLERTMLRRLLRALATLIEGEAAL